MLDEIILASIPIIAGTVGWVVKRQVSTNDKVTEHDKQLALREQGFDDLKELINARFDTQVLMADNLGTRLERVERKVLNGAYTPI